MGDHAMPVFAFACLLSYREPRSRHRGFLVCRRVRARAVKYYFDVTGRHAGAIALTTACSGGVVGTAIGGIRQ